MKVSQYIAQNNLSERQWKALKAAFKAAHPTTEMLKREGSKTFLITDDVKALLDALLPPKRNTIDDIEVIEVITPEIVEYGYSAPQNDSALVYGNSNARANNASINRLTETLTLTSELFERLDDAIDIHRQNMTAQQNAITNVNEELELKITEVREKLLQVRKEEIKAKTRIENGTEEATKKHLDLSTLLSQFSSHLG